MINEISSHAQVLKPEAFNADWARSREHYQQAARQIQEKSDQTRQVLSRQLDVSLQRIREQVDLQQNTRLSFGIQEGTHRVIIKVMDSRSNQVIRQIPPEPMLRISEEIQKVLGSVLDRVV